MNFEGHGSFENNQNEHFKKKNKKKVRSQENFGT